MASLGYFAEQHDIELRKQRFRVYFTPPAGGPLIVLQHGIGSAALTFALLAQELVKQMSDDPPGVLAFDSRFHGASVPTDSAERPNYSTDVLVDDCEAVVREMIKRTEYTGPILLVGHSMGGTIASKLAYERRLPNLRGLVVLDAVEGYAMQSLRSMPSLVRSWPSEFASEQEAVDWTVSHHNIRNKESAEVSVPSLLRKGPDSKFHWVVDLLSTQQFWDGWFVDLDKMFLQAPVSRLLVLAGTGRLDKELMLGQMQGKYQLVVLNDSGHFIQEDHPRKTATIISEFWTRNQRPALIKPVFGTFRTD